MATNKELISKLPDSTRMVLMDTGLVLNVSLSIAELNDKELADAIAELIVNWVKRTHEEEAK